MKKPELIKYVEELKKKYKDHEMFTDKKGKDKIRFAVSEFQVPKGLENHQLVLIKDEDGKTYLTFTLNLGTNEKIKKEKAMIRKAKYDKLRQLRQELKQAGKDLDSQKMVSIVEQIKQIKG